MKKILLVFIFILLLCGCNIKENDKIPSFAIFKWYREIDGIKEYIVFNKDNSFEYYNEKNESIVDISCNTYEYNKKKNEIIVKCNDKDISYEIISYKDSKLKIKDNDNIKEFKLEEEY